MLLEISKPENYRKTATATGDHPDRCDALWTLVECYHLQDKLDEGLRTCDELQAVITAIRRGKKSTDISDIFWQMIEDKRAELQAAKNALTINNTMLPQIASPTEELWTPSPRLGSKELASGVQVVEQGSEIRRR
jgi:hypothetical protein